MTTLMIKRLTNDAIVVENEDTSEKYGFSGKQFYETIDRIACELGFEEDFDAIIDKRAQKLLDHFVQMEEDEAEATAYVPDVTTLPVGFDVGKVVDALNKNLFLLDRANALADAFDWGKQTDASFKFWNNEWATLSADGKMSDTAVATLKAWIKLYEAQNEAEPIAVSDVTETPQNEPEVSGSVEKSPDVVFDEIRVGDRVTSEYWDDQTPVQVMRIHDDNFAKIECLRTHKGSSIQTHLWPLARLIKVPAPEGGEA